MNFRIVIVLLTALVGILWELELAPFFVGAVGSEPDEKRWTTADDHALRDLLRSGTKFEAITTELGRTAADVGRRIRELGLET